MADFSEIEGRKLLEELTPILGENEAQKELMESIVRLLALPDEEFILIAPSVETKFERALNNPNDKIALAQAANASGIKVEDLTASFKEMMDEVDKSSLPVVKRDFLKLLVSSMINSIADTEGIAKKTMRVAIEKMSEDVRIPEYAHITDSGLDLFSTEDVTIAPGETKLVSTGIKIALPPGYEVQVRPKSGRALKTKLRVANSPGTIDQGYRDEIRVIIENVDAPIKDITYHEEDGHLVIDSILHGSSFTIGKGEKFAQIVLAEVPKIEWYEVENVSEIGEDRSGGFGSTSIYSEEDERYGSDLN